jgi:hypothetical protein
MPKIDFYCQKRIDGGLRTGMNVDGEAALHLFEPGRRDSDPALLWFVDLRCQGRSLPTEIEAARRWLLDRADVIRTGLLNLAEEFRAGMDPDVWPLQWRITGTTKGLRMTIVFSAARRVDARRMAEVLRNVAEHWEERIERLLTEEETLAQQR